MQSNPAIFAAFLVYTLVMAVERTEIIDLLKSIYPFRRLTDSELEQVVNSVTAVEYRSGQTINEQGEEAYTLYIVMEGKVHLTPRLG